MRRHLSRKEQEQLRALRVAAFLAQDGRCIYCARPIWEGQLEVQEGARRRLLAQGLALTYRELGQLRATAEHLVRLADGGRTEPGNVAAACRACNGARGDNGPLAWKVLRAGLGSG